jgi:phage shock protein PspC (stress-responsive transcriptional regulator)
MNQTVTVNISGIVFHIEVDAYENLKRYLNKIRSYFKNAEESEEIMTDIEARIAELFNEKITSQNQVVNTKDVEEVITIMGKPEQYIDEDEEENVKEESSYSKQSTYTAAKKLFRDPDDRIIGGVASGIASYFGIASIWVRLFLVFSTLIGGFGPFVYLILWMVMPEAKTASDKLQMKGDPVNIDNLSKTFKGEAEKVSDHLKNNGQQYGKKVETAFEAIFSFIGQILRGIFKVFGKIFGVIFLIAGTFMLVGLLGMLLGSETIFSITTDGIFSLDSSEFFNLIFLSEDQFHIAIIGALITIGLPVIMLIYAGANLLFNVKTYPGVSIGLIVFWVIGIFMCAMVGIRMGTELSNDEEYVQTEVLDNSINDFYIKTNDLEMPGEGVLEDKYSSISLEEDSIFMNDVRFYIHKSKSDSIEIKVIKEGNGKTIKNAIKNAKMINYNYDFNDSTIVLNNFLATLKKNKIRGQQVKFKLYLPVGKSVYLDKSLKYIIHDIDNVTDTWDPHMLGKKWVMLKEGLTCLDCNEIEGVTQLELDSIRTFSPVLEEE